MSAAEAIQQAMTAAQSSASNQMQMAMVAMQMQMVQSNMGGAANQEFRSGDWLCPGCSAHNFQKNFICFKCKASRFPGMEPATMAAMGLVAQSHNFKPGDWICKLCNEHNFANKTACFKCSSPKDVAGSKTMPQMTQAMMMGKQGEYKPGDWVCKLCNEHNFANRQTCFKCSAAKSIAQGVTM